MAGLFNKVGLTNLAIVFLMSDTQVVDKKLLMMVNKLLASGEIPDLLSDYIVNIGKNEVTSA